MSESFELTTNSLLAKIEPKPDDQRQFVILIGYVLVDESSRGDNPAVRVYPELDLRTYLEIQIRDVVWAEKAIPGQESSPTKLVINAAAKVNRVTTTARSVETEFLGGIIADNYLPTAAAGVTINVCDQPGGSQTPSGLPASGRRSSQERDGTDDHSSNRLVRWRTQTYLVIRMNTSVLGPALVQARPAAFAGRARGHCSRGRRDAGRGQRRSVSPRAWAGRARLDRRWRPEHSQCRATQPQSQDRGARRRRLLDQAARRARAGKPLHAYQRGRFLRVLASRKRLPRPWLVTCHEWSCATGTALCTHWN